MEGGGILNLYTIEYVMTKYPQLPSDAVESIAKAYWSIGSLHKIGMTWGLKFVLRSKVSLCFNNRVVLDQMEMTHRRSQVLFKLGLFNH
jgi:dsRNA-specific ribonuclease